MDPKLIFALILVGVLAVTVAGFLYTRAKAQALKSRVVVDLESDPSRVRGAVGQPVMVGGLAGGEAVVSPWTKREGLLFDATRVHERRNREGQTSHHSQHLGTHWEDLYVHDERETTLVRVRRTSEVALAQFPKASFPLDSLGDLLSGNLSGVLPGEAKDLSIGGLNLGTLRIGGSSRDRVDEAAVQAGDRIWLLGELGAGSEPNAYVLEGERITISALGHAGLLGKYARGMKIWAGVGGAAAVGAVVLGVLSLTAG